MPRAETTKASAGSQPYQSPSYDNSPSSSSSATSINATPTPATSKAAGAPKKKHVCPTCERAFTTSGHLARHSRVHTGERNHKCPFPGCETRCSRADNLQQHYRIHLSPGSRRSSARSRNAAAAASNSSSGSNPGNLNAPPLTSVPAARRIPVRATSAASVSSASSSVSGSAHEPGSSTDSTHSNSPPVSPPPLEQATMRSLYSTSPSSSSNVSTIPNLPNIIPPPDSPPPLTQATLPATVHHYEYEGSISRGTNSASPADVAYSLGGQNMLQQGVALTNTTATSQYGYRTVTAGGYQDDVSGGFGAGNYGSSASSSSGSPSTSYAAGDYQTTAPPTSGLSGTSLHQIHTRHNSPTNSMSSSRHSISHISSAALSYPPSPVSAQSVLSSSSVHQPSGPPTPTYPAMSSYGDDSSAAYHYTSGQGLSHQQATMIHGSYPIHAGGRFDSPSPTLAPIQDGTRYTQQVANANTYSSARRDSHNQQQLPNVMERHQAHIYQPQPASVLGGEFGMGYQQQYAHAHAHAHSAWKDVGMRKGLGTLVG
ncbi:hypothetical protein H1R20_g7368, partial [Candolleomyces eurysporus]